MATPGEAAAEISAMLEFLERHHRAFHKKFGREPGPDDPMFFDPKAEQPTPITVRRWKEMASRQALTLGVRLDDKVVEAVEAWADKAAVLAETMDARTAARRTRTAPRRTGK